MKMQYMLVYTSNKAIDSYLSFHQVTNTSFFIN